MIMAEEASDSHYSVSVGSTDDYVTKQNFTHNKINLENICG